MSCYFCITEQENLPLENLKKIMLEGFAQVHTRLDALEQKFENVDIRLQRIEWMLVSYKREFEVLHGFCAQSDEQIHELRHTVRKLSPSMV